MALTACAPPKSPANLEPAAQGGAYQAQYRDPEVRREAQPFLRSAQMNAARCRPFAGGAGDGSGGKLGGRAPIALRGELLSRGDLLDLRLPEDATFTDEYVVSRDGTLKLPYLTPIPAQGRSTTAVAGAVRSGLVEGGFYTEEPAISLLVEDFAAARVAISGAVFEPRTADIGGVPGDQVDVRRQGALGDSTEGRNISVALRVAGGVRPDADLSAVRLTRGGTNYRLDLRGALEGRSFDDVMLITGDEVFVPTRDCFQDWMLVPGPISPPGVSLYLSNLTQPATGNAPSAIGQTVREVPYGTRFMQAVVDSNCVGGARATSANRSAALFSRNPVTKVSVVIERGIEDMRTRAERDDYDPYLLPGDAIACYDSTITNVTEIGRVLGIVGAATLLK
ncbi:polysaccharide biosynthesis protein [Pseudooceanicola sediminis]|uniref:Polysaccharide biosynthesis protein n=1 Tax=Pseudooceanicola sediminis TaxID=2211117 RepID=A0A399J7C7_9RHOB|nr:polysaccharide biosynthesis/export family protein [Pseudooceanicola sediminis]KAA2314251.1 polysaccharide biosynthesis protein [Puniceibacterium sp. HSS470]RII39892.1 polysaccharide biosynthesis protein [Pseudooceanicola sediminis]|tara:strand:- start:38551 stop:39732 length:1182 start_codon:yes stop_codon:yes gene_type:complete